MLTENPTWVKQTYTALNPDWFIDMNLPTFNDDEGVIVITTTSGIRIDQLHYFDTWQFPLIDDVEGVALERIYFNSATQDSLNWQASWRSTAALIAAKPAGSLLNQLKSP